MRGFPGSSRRGPVVVGMLLVAGSGMLPGGTVGAQPDRERIDGIAAIVGEEIILRSDVELQLQVVLQSTGRSPASIPEEEIIEYRQRILEQLINEKLIIARARRDSIEVPRSEVEREIDGQIRYITQTLGGEEAFQQALQAEGLSLQELRTRYYLRTESELLQQKLADKYGLRRPVSVSRRDGAEFLRNQGDHLLVLRGLRLRPPEGLDPDATTRARLLQLRERIVTGGEDFATLAQNHSQDSGSGRFGGDLGRAERGTYVPAFEQAVWALDIGEVSQPIRTEFGWHLIQVMARDEQTVQARHILLTPSSTGAMIAELKPRIDVLKEAIGRGDAFEALLNLAEVTPAEQQRGGYFGFFLLPLSDPNNAAINARLPADWQQPLQSLERGQWSDALEDTSGVYLLQRLSMQERTIDLVLREDFPLVERLVQVGRQTELFDNWLDNLREQTYVEIKKP
jgi:peptidyl-prolyl cis-trans isomerase SurA